MVEAFRAGLCAIGLLAAIYLVFYVAALGWGQGIGVTELQSDIRALDRCEELLNVRKP